MFHSERVNCNVYWRVIIIFILFFYNTIDSLYYKGFSHTHTLSMCHRDLNMRLLIYKSRSFFIGLNRWRVE